MHDKASGSIHRDEFAIATCHKSRCEGVTLSIAPSCGARALSTLLLLGDPSTPTPFSTDPIRQHVLIDVLSLETEQECTSHHVLPRPIQQHNRSLVLHTAPFLALRVRRLRETSTLYHRAPPGGKRIYLSQSLCVSKCCFTGGFGVGS